MVEIRSKGQTIYRSGRGGGFRAMFEDGEVWFRILEVAEIQTEVDWPSVYWDEDEVRVLRQLLHGLVKRTIETCFRSRSEFVDYYRWGEEYLKEHRELEACFPAEADEGQA